MIVGWIVVLLLLLVLSRKTMPALQPIMYMSVFVIVAERVFSSYAYPFFQALVSQFAHVPYSTSLLLTALCYLFGRWLLLFCGAVGYEPLGELVYDGIRLFMALYWLRLLTPELQVLQTFFEGY